MVILFSGEAIALDKKRHEPVTRHAIEIYTKQCKAVPKLSKDEEDKIVKANEAEDHGNIEHIFESIRRARNWHFYDICRYKDAPKNCNPLGEGFINKSLHARYDKLIRELAKAKKHKNREKAIELSGRLLHYIQDMGVPAHVAPIYHAKPEPGLATFVFKLFGKETIPDGFDAYVIKKPEMDASACREPLDLGMEPKDKLNEILNNFAIETRHTFSEKSSGPWKKFWNIKDNNHPGNEDGFVAYGELKNDGFNKEVCKNKKIKCDKFYSDRYKAMVNRSVITLRYILQWYEK